MSTHRVRKRDGSTTIIKNGRIVGNVAGPGTHAPEPADDAVLRAADAIAGDSSSVTDGAEYVVMHQAFSEAQPTFREDDDFIAPTRVETETASSIAGIPDDLTAAARLVLHTHGFEGQRADDILVSAVESKGLHRDTMLLPGDHAASEVSRFLSWSPEHTYVSETLLGRIRRGEIVLSGSELEVIQAVHSGAVESQQLPDEAIGVDAAWQVPFEQRNCTQCGQFVGRLLSHACPAGGLAGKIASNPSVRDKGKIKVLVPTRDGEVELKKIDYVKLDKLSSYTVEELQDAYLQSPHLYADEFDAGGVWNEYQDDADSRFIYNRTYIDLTEDHQSAILLSYVEKPLFGEPRIVLPRKLRQAYLEKPPSAKSSAALLVPQLIEPPLTKEEIGRLLDTGQLHSQWAIDYDTARILLSNPRTKEMTEIVIANTPTESGKALSWSGNLPAAVVSEMASSGDQMVRRQAASAPNLPEDDLYRLATDPDPDVRAAIAIGTPGEGEEIPEVQDQMENRYRTEIVKAITGYGRRVRRIGREEPWGVLYSPLGKNPGLLSTFVNDPDDDIAEASLACYPDRRGLEALGRVTSRKRLQRLHNALPYLWGSTQVYGEKTIHNNDLSSPGARSQERNVTRPGGSRAPARDGTPWEDVMAYEGTDTSEWDEIVRTTKIVQSSNSNLPQRETPTRRDQLIAQGQEIIRKRLAG